MTSEETAAAFSKAAALSNWSRWDAAKVTCQEALRKEPQDGRLQSLECWVGAVSGDLDLEEAVSRARRLEARHRDLLEPHLVEAAIEYRLGHGRAAVQMLRELEPRYPGRISLHTTIGCLLGQLGESKTASAAYEQARASGEIASPGHRFNALRCVVRSGDRETARDLLARTPAPERLASRLRRFRALLWTLLLLSAFFGLVLNVVPVLVVTLAAGIALGWEGFYFCGSPVCVAGPPATALVAALTARLLGRPLETAEWLAPVALLLLSTAYRANIVTLAAGVRVRLGLPAGLPGPGPPILRLLTSTWTPPWRVPTSLPTSDSRPCASPCWPPQQPSSSSFSGFPPPERSGWSACRRPGSITP